jgi:hypothetical protein
VGYFMGYYTIWLALVKKFFRPVLGIGEEKSRSRFALGRPPPLKVKIDYVLKKTDSQIVNSVYSRMSRLRGKKHGTPCNW